MVIILILQMRKRLKLIRLEAWVPTEKTWLQSPALNLCTQQWAPLSAALPLQQNL